MPNGFPIDLASVNWLYVAILAAFVFVASLIGNFLSFGRRVSGALLTAILFAAAFVAWSYYPHGRPRSPRLHRPPPPRRQPRSRRLRRSAPPTRSATSRRRGNNAVFRRAK